MVDYVRNASGNWETTTQWTPNGLPTGTDNVTIGAYSVTIGSGITAQCATLSMSGTNESTRSSLIINSTGRLNIYANATQATWTTLSLTNGGTLDLRGNSWAVNYTDGTGRRVEVLSSGTGENKIYSSTTVGFFGGGAGGVGYGKLSLVNCKIENTAFRYGSSWYPGNGYKLDNVCFYNCARIENDGYVDDADEWIVRNVSMIGTQEADGYKAMIHCRDKGGTITGSRILENFVVDFSNAASAIIRLRYFPAIIQPTGIYLYQAYLEGLNIHQDCQFDKFFLSTGSVLGEGIYKASNFYSYTDLNNPHTWQNMCSNLNHGVVEAAYPIGTTDAGDHFILSTGGTHLIQNSIIIDGWGGTCLNALGANFGGNYTLKHCTYVVDIHDAVYGYLARNENSGIFTNGADVHSNIVYARSNPISATNCRVINIETAGDDQIDICDNNVLFGVGSTLSALFYQVTSASKGAYGSQAGWGLNNKIGVDPNFVDHSRGLLSWGATFGLSTKDQVVKKLLYGVNGYNSTTHSHSDSASTDIDQLLEYVRGGYAPQNIALFNAGYDSITIGAIEYQAPVSGAGIVSRSPTSRSITSRGITSR